MLESLYAGAVEDARKRQDEIPLAAIEQQALRAPAALDAMHFLSAGNNINVIAEIKRASPSKGHLANISDPAALAREYESAGASAISVLTEQRSFLGSLDDLAAVRSAVSIPILRKDFIANEYQVLEARAHGADIVLLIAAGLKPETLIRLKELIEDLGMYAFIETHNLDEVQFASSIGASLVGINARDLTTFETDRTLFQKLVGELPANCIKVAESAVRDARDVAEYASSGAQCVLVGEALVTGEPRKLLESFTQIPKV